MCKILKKRTLNTAGTTVEMVVEAPLVARKCLAGQFIIYRLDEFSERIPLTIADYDREKGTVTIMFQLVGKSTIMLGRLNEGDKIADFVGPLGKPTQMEGIKRAAIIGGGVGCAIAYPVAKEMYSRGIDVDMVAGFRTKDLVILEDEMRAHCANLFITTDDGTYGEKGTTSDKLKILIGADGRVYDEVFAIGPALMMKLISQITKPYGIKTTVSLNPIMIDGTGMCGVCRCTVGGEIKFACVDGPEFDAHLVDWDELIHRASFYKEEEAEAKAHLCNLIGGARHV